MLKRKIITHFGDILMVIPLFAFYVLTKNIYLLFYLILFLFILEIAGSLIKVFFFKDRPIPMQYNNIIAKIIAGSFPSIHTARTFTIFLFSFYYIPEYSIFFFIYFLLVATSRVMLKKHFWIDIAGGIMLSTILFLLYIIFLFDAFQSLNAYIIKTIYI